MGEHPMIKARDVAITIQRQRCGELSILETIIAVKKNGLTYMNRDQI
jgi:hypothetical protein